MKLLTLARDLKRRKARERQRLFVAEGVRAVEELVRSPLRLRGALVTAELASSPRGAALREALARRGVEPAEVTPAELADAADTETPQGVLAIAEQPAHALESLVLPPRARLLVLDAVQDPGNVGTMLRTAAAFSVAAAVALPGTVDLWNAKVVRGAMGAHFRLPTVSCTWDALDAFRAAAGFDLWVADADGTPLDRVAPPPRLAIVLGNEGAGASAEARARATGRVAIPIAADVESLNVAVSAGILLHSLRP